MTLEKDAYNIGLLNQIGLSKGDGLISGARKAGIPPAIPTGLTSSFVVDTILGQLDWTDNSSGVAQYEIYSNTNGAGRILLTTTIAGAVSYQDTLCKQNASVVYEIRAKKGSLYSDYVTATALVTPLCFKTNQTTRSDLYINRIYVNIGKTVNIDWGDGNNQNTVGNVNNLIHTYAASATNIFNVKISGDISNINFLYLISQPVRILGDISNWLIPTGNTALYLYSNSFTGKAPNIKTAASALLYRVDGNSLSGSNITVFREAATGYDLSDQNVLFPTSEVNAFFLAAANWYQVNAPTANCTYDLAGANMGIPTDGASNEDILRLMGYYSSAGKVATVTIRTS